MRISGSKGLWTVNLASDGSSLIISIRGKDQIQAKNLESISDENAKYILVERIKSDEK